jgi:uncharacterized protein (UPF0332 family)
MKKMTFLVKLVQEGKLQLVEPSEEIKQSYVEKSESNLISARILLNNNRLEESVGLAYYSMYHILTALLFKVGIKSENHSASIILLKELFNYDNKDISEAKTERIDKQYYIDFKITQEEVQNMLRKAELFNGNIIDFISKINSNEVKRYRERFKELT